MSRIPFPKNREFTAIYGENRQIVLKPQPVNLLVGPTGINKVTNRTTGLIVEFWTLGISFKTSNTSY